MGSVDRFIGRVVIDFGGLGRLDRYRLRPGSWLGRPRLARWEIVDLGDDYALRNRRVISSAAGGSKFQEIHGGDNVFYGKDPVNQFAVYYGMSASSLSTLDDRMHYSIDCLERVQNFCGSAIALFVVRKKLWSTSQAR